MKSRSRHHSHQLNSTIQTKKTKSHVLNAVYQLVIGNLTTILWMFISDFLLTAHLLSKTKYDNTTVEDTCQRETFESGLLGATGFTARVRQENENQRQIQDELELPSHRIFGELLRCFFLLFQKNSSSGNAGSGILVKLLLVFNIHSIFNVSCM